MPKANEAARTYERHTGAPEYRGVLWRSGAVRLAVTASGTRYLVQRERPNGWWSVATWALDRSALGERLPAEVPADALEGLPERPREVGRPWADREAERAAESVSADGHDGELDRDGNARLLRVRGDDGDELVLVQRRGKAGWRTRVACATAGQLLAAVQAAGTHDGGPRRVRSDRLRAVVELLLRRGELFARDAP